MGRDVAGDADFGLMVDRALIVSKVNYGLGKGGVIMGYPIAQYRPNGTGTPIAAGNLVATLTGDFDSHDRLDFRVQPKIGAFMFYLLADPTSLQAGDYLVGQGTNAGEDQTYFVAETGGVEPAMCIRCNVIFGLSRPVSGTLAGVNPPGGDSTAIEETLLTGWPANALVGGRGEKGDVDLPGDVRMAGWKILMPVLPAGVEIRGSDILTDATGLRRVVSGAELTVAGYRIEAIQEAT